MKKLLLAICIGVIFFEGCKKQESPPPVPVTYCKNTCYICYSKNNFRNVDSFCNSDLTEAEFRERWEIDSLLGYICREVPPSILHEIKGENTSAQITAEEASGLTCIDGADYHPDYFNYDSFATHSARCEACHDTIAHRYLEIYFDTLGRNPGFVSEVPQYFLIDSLPGIIQYCSDRVDGMHCGLPSVTKFTVTNYLASYLRKLQYEPICSTCVIKTQDEKDYWIFINSWVDFNPGITNGLKPAIFRDCQ